MPDNALSSQELKTQLDVYRHQAMTQGLRVLEAGLSGQVASGGMSDMEKQSLIARYHEMLRDLDKQQTLLIQEHEKTGRVSMTMKGNLISAFARVDAAARTGQASNISATTGALTDRLTQLDKTMEAEGPKSVADLGPAYKQTVTNLNGYVRDGKVADANFGHVVLQDLRNLQATDPRLIPAYVESVVGTTGVWLPDYLNGEAAASAGGLPPDLQKIDTLLRVGMEADDHAQSRGQVINKERFQKAADLYRAIGTPTGKQFADNIMSLIPLIDTEHVDRNISVTGAPPPPKTATHEEKAAWVQAVSRGANTLDAEGNVVEKRDDGTEDKVSYDEFSQWHQPGMDNEFTQKLTGGKYLDDTRKGITDKLRALEASTDRADLETKAHIMGSQEFRDWASARSYPVGTPAEMKSAFKDLIQERIVQIGRSRSDKNMIKDIDALTGGRSATALGVAAAAVRQGVRDVFKPGQTHPAAMITNGAQGPSEKAPEISEDSTATSDAKSKIVEPTTHTGKDGWVYRVNGSNVQVIGGPKGKSNATPEKPIDLSPQVAAKVKTELGLDKEETPVKSGSVKDKTSPLYQHEEAKAETPSLPGFGPDKSARLQELAAMDKDAGAEEPESEDGPPASDGPDMSEMPDQEAGSLSEAYQKAEAPVVAPPVDRRAARLARLGDARQAAAERVGTSEVDTATGETTSPVKPKDILGALGGGLSRAAASAVPGTPAVAPTPTLGPTRNAEEAPGPETAEDKLMPISRRRRFELLRGLAT